MANDSYGSVSRCRVFVDYIQYAKAMGMVEEYQPYSMTQVNDDWTSPFNFDPTKTTIYSPNSAGLQYCGWYIKFKTWNNQTFGLQFRNMMDTINYFGMLNHNIGRAKLNSDSQYVRDYHIGFTNMTDAGVQSENCWSSGFSSGGIVGNPMDIKNEIGYSITSQTGFSDHTTDAFERMRFVVSCRDESGNGYWTPSDQIKIGALTAGRYFDLPVNANLSLNQTFSYDGVQTKRTFGGADLTQVNYTRKKWGDLGAWTHIDLSEYANPSDALNNEDYSTAGFQGKRSWDLAWSFISKEDMFPMNFENNMSGYYDADTMQWNSDNYDSDVEGTHKDNTLGWLSLCCFGAIPFIFQADNTKTTFAICVLDKPSISIKRVAPDLYNIKMKIVEI